MTVYDVSTTRDYLAAYGPNAALWPDPKRASQALALHKDALGHATAEAQALEDWLAPTLGAASPAPSELLSKRILRAAAAPKQSGSTNDNLAAPQNLANVSQRKLSSRLGAMNFKHFGRAAAGFLVVAAVGIGTVNLQSPPIEASSTELGEWQEAADDLGLSDVYSWVMETPDDQDS